jgi:hypothetical protein
VNLMRSGGGGGEACVVAGDTSSEAGNRWVVAMAKLGMLSMWLGGVGGLVGSKLVAVRLVPRLELLGMVVAERHVVVVGIDGVGFVCIARGVCNPSGLSRRTTFFLEFGVFDRLLKDGLRVILKESSIYVRLGRALRGLPCFSKSC